MIKIAKNSQCREENFKSCQLNQMFLIQSVVAKETGFFYFFQKSNEKNDFLKKTY